MLNRPLKEYPNYLGQTIRQDLKLTDSIYKAARKALELPQYIVINNENTKVSIIPSIQEGEYIMVRNVGDELTISYEKTAALKLKQPYNFALQSLFEEKEVYGLMNLFKFNSKAKEGEAVFYEKMLNFNLKISPEMKDIMLEKDANKKLELMQKLSLPAGECTASFTDLNMLQILNETFVNLKVMKQISEKQFKKLGTESAEGIKEDSHLFIEDLQFLHETSIENKYNSMNPYKFHNDKVWAISSLPETLCFQSQSSGYLAHGDGKDNWTIYPYSKEYAVNSNYKDIMKKIKDKTINDTVEAMLKIENGNIVYVGNTIYNMAIELHDCVNALSNEKNLQPKKPKLK